MSGLIVYDGFSAYDGKPIVCVLIKSKANKKTGAMVQQYIIRSDLHPIDASRTGADYSICGNCKHRGAVNPNKTTGEAVGRTCYVKLYQGPASVYKAYCKGVYSVARTMQDVGAFLHGSMLRIGAYGDPSALPHGLNDALIQYSSGHTAYTHGFTVSDAMGADTARYSMVSADSKAEAIRAHSMGYRTFRVIPIREINQPLLHNEILCPNTTHDVQCNECKLCNGQKYNGARSIAIIAHGAMKNKV